MKKIVDTKISWGYLPLIEIFARANNLELGFECYSEELCEHEKFKTSFGSYIRITFDEDSPTASYITFMSIRHLGFENMLCDYLIKCNIGPNLIPIGKYVMKKSDEEMERDWQEHRKKIGLAR
jgi:hypothetical protein